MGTCALALTLMTLTTTACVVPIPATPADADGDAGANGIPDIVSASPAQFKFPGPIELTRNARQDITVTLKDMDRDDVLRLRVFRNYPESFSPIDEKTPGTGAANGERLWTLDTSTWCIGAIDNQQLIFTLVVADRDWAENNVAPVFQSVVPGGLTSTREWIARCVTPP